MDSYSPNIPQQASHKFGEPPKGFLLPKDRALACLSSVVQLSRGSLGTEHTGGRPQRLVRGSWQLRV